ncbi:MAG: hypothetical protein ACKO96_35495, partial [Flammeovirgaceae bacterium]
CRNDGQPPWFTAMRLNLVRFGLPTFQHQLLLLQQQEYLPLPQRRPLILRRVTRLGNSALPYPNLFCQISIFKFRVAPLLSPCERPYRRKCGRSANGCHYKYAS